MSRLAARALALAAAACSLPFMAAPGLAADTAGPSVQITSPDEFTPGRQATVTVDTHTGGPVPDDTWVILDVRLPDRLTAVATEQTGLVCSITSAQDVECAGVATFSDGSVSMTVDTGPGDDLPSTIEASLQVGDAAPVTASKDVHIIGTPSGLDVQIDAPDRIRPGEPATVRVTGHTQTPVTDGSVGFSLDLQSDRLNATAASAPGFDCTVRPRQDFDGGFAASRADCSATALADTVTLTVTVTADPGAGEFGFMDATLRVGNSSQTQSADVIVAGSDTTTVSGRVWNDLDQDGKQDEGEPGISGVTVAGPITFTTTGPDGRYVLDDVDRGDTGVLFVAPGKFTFSKPNVGDDAHDSDVTTVTRECPDCVMGTVSFTLTGPATVDAGLFDPTLPPTSPNQGPGGHATTAPVAQAAPVRTELASTGAPIVPVAGLGVLLLAAGAALTLLQRRHRRTT